MKNRLHDKKAGIFITFILFVISLTETIIRGLQPNYSFVATELGQTFSIAIFTALILFFTLIKKDRVCYICYAVYIGWFILEEAFSLPGTLSTLSSTISNIDIRAAAHTIRCKLACRRIIKYCKTLRNKRIRNRSDHSRNRYIYSRNGGKLLIFISRKG